MTDIFREVEEEVRRERYQLLWKKYGAYLITAAALIVLAVAAYQLWLVWDRSQREAASRQFQAAQQMAQTGRLADAEKAFAKLAAEGPSGYATLAKFHQAAVMLAQGKRDAALALYGSLAQTDDPVMNGAARLRIAWALADSAPRAQIEKTVAPMSQPDNPWRFAAREVLAYAELHAGNRAAATEAYARLAAEKDAPTGIRQRAGAIAEYLKANPQANPQTGAAIPAPAQQESKP